MPNITPSIIRIVAIATFAGGLAFAGPLSAAPGDTAVEPPQNATDHSPQAAALRVEDRIKILHDKLSVTSAEEPKWNEVAKAMRDNDANINQLILQRHQSPASATAVDDLQSYEKIAQAHTDGLQKLIPAFQALYNDMPDEQRKNADVVFSSFEGHHADATATKQQ
jgi:hypothetical protein